MRPCSRWALGSGPDPGEVFCVTTLTGDLGEVFVEGLLLLVGEQVIDRSELGLLHGAIVAGEAQGVKFVVRSHTRGLIGLS